jgi:hypothetical protein
MASILDDVRFSMPPASGVWTGGSKPGDAAYEPLAIDALRGQDGIITEITTFDQAVFDYFDLPPALTTREGTR